MTVYIGEIRLFAGNFAPNGWLFCEGQLLPISEYDSLFNLIGTTYGGDGQDTFGLPDLRGRLPMHQGNGFILGETGGVEEVTLTSSQIPSHGHPLRAAATLGDQVSPANRLPANSFNVTAYINSPPDGNMNAAAIAPTGGSQPHSNMQPYLCLNFIISLFGVFPSPS
jgi:microcystin-dependent protein